ncbi:MAG: SHOCT domain-containing protein [Phormidesmis sp.]
MAILPVSARTRKIAVALAFSGAIAPFPTAWIHKFYIGQYLWGIVYLVLAPTSLPRIACCLEGLWYLSQSDESFAGRFPKAGSILLPVKPSDSLGTVTGKTAAAAEKTAENISQQASQVAIALRELDQLRQEGLMTEYEFEQKRRKLLEQV